MCKHLISAFLQKHPLLPPYFRRLVRNRSRVEGGGVKEIHPDPASPHVQLKAGEGALTDFVPLLCPKLFFFCVCLVIIFMLERKHNRVTREKKKKKQATVKLVISTATITRESNIISTWGISKVWLKVYNYSLVCVMDVLHRLHPLAFSFAAIT